MTKHVKVTFEHKGADGKPRHVGDTVTLDDEEAAIRLNDGFVQEITPAPKPTPKPSATKPAGQ